MKKDKGGETTKSEELPSDLNKCLAEICIEDGIEKIENFDWILKEEFQKMSSNPYRKWGDSFDGSLGRHTFRLLQAIHSESFNNNIRKTIDATFVGLGDNEKRELFPYVRANFFDKNGLNLRHPGAYPSGVPAQPVFV